MTRELTLRTVDIPAIHKFAVGFDNIFNELLRLNAQQTNVNYPPYNLVKHNEDKFTIELAVAGFRDSEIEITVENGTLIVKGNQEQSTLDETVEYVHKGISARQFARTFPLADHVEVLGATLEHGILSITLERRVPEEQKPKKIAITYNK